MYVSVCVFQILLENIPEKKTVKTLKCMRTCTHKTLWDTHPPSPCLQAESPLIFPSELLLEEVESALSCRQ